MSLLPHLILKLYGFSRAVGERWTISSGQKIISMNGWGSILNTKRKTKIPLGSFSKHWTGDLVGPPLFSSFLQVLV